MIAIADKIFFKAKSIIRSNKIHYINLKVLTYQDNNYSKLINTASKQKCQ